MLDILKRFNIEDNKSVQTPIVPGTKVDRDYYGIDVDDTYY